VQHKSVQFLEIIGGGRVPEVLVGTWIVMALLLIFGWMARSALAAAADPTMPDEGVTLRAVAEVLVEWIDGFVAGVMETHGYRDLVPFLGSLFLFILAANFFGLIPGMEPPTSYSDLTFALGTISFVFYIYQGLKANGVAYLRSFLGPLLLLAPLMLPIELADNLFRPFSLGVRLYANMFADHQVLSIFTGLTKLFVPLAFYTLGGIVCVIQALIFMVLTMSYIKLAQSHEH
jgi:F-type H+-transporting ATPase subunit a